MTKVEEEKLLKRISNLEKQIAELNKRLENNKIEKHVYSISETSKILNVTPQAVYAMVERGELETVKLGHTKVLGHSLRSKLGA